MLSKLASELNQPVIALHGMGGIGKTRLAVEYAWRHARDYSAVLFVSAETPEMLSTSLASLAATLNLPQQNEPQDPVKIAAVLAWLAANSDWLLILDNVDDEKAAGAVSALLPKLANGKTLITARYERFPPAVTLLRVDVLEPEPARDFLLARTQTGRRQDEDDSALAAELAEELGYLALALEQAGAFIAAQRISFERYLAYWRDERARVVDWFDMNASGSNHDKGLAAVWTTSVARLSTQARRLFDRIAFLAPEPIPEFLLDVKVPKSGLRAEERPKNPYPHPEEPRSGVSKDAPEAGVAAFGPFETRPSGAPQGEAEDKGSDAQAEDRFDARAALGELYAYSLAAPAEIEGRYRLPAFVIHRLVQDFARANMDEKRKNEMLREALVWVNAAFEGDPCDVRNWSRLDPLAVHAQMVAETADKAAISQPTALLMNEIGQLFRGQTRNREAEPLMRRTLEIDELSFGPDHPNVARDLNNLAALMLRTNRLAEAEPLMRRALEIDEKSFGSYHPNVAAKLNNLAALLHESNRLAEAEPLIRRALEIDEKSFGPNHPDVARDLNTLARLMQQSDRLAEAGPLLRRALQIEEKSFGPHHPSVARGLNNLAAWLQDTNRLAEAEPLISRALEIVEQYFGPDHPDVATVLNNLAVLLQNTNRPGVAEPLMRRALGIDEKSFGPDHPNVARDLNNLAQLLQDMNRLYEAEPLMYRALHIEEKSFGPQHPNVAIKLNNLAALLQEANRFAEAEPLMRCAIGIDEKSFGPDHLNVARGLNNLGGLLRDTNRTPEAEPLFHRALKIAAVTLGHDHPNTKGVANNYLNLLRARGASKEEAEAKVAATMRGE